MLLQIAVDMMLLALAAGAYLWVKRSGGRNVRDRVGRTASWRAAFTGLLGGSSTAFGSRPTGAGPRAEAAIGAGRLAGASGGSESGPLGDARSAEGSSADPEAAAAAEALVDEVALALDDIYREFAAEARRVRQDAACAMDALRQELMRQVRELEERVQQLEAQLAALRQSAGTAASPGRQPRDSSVNGSAGRAADKSARQVTPTARSTAARAPSDGQVRPPAEGTSRELPRPHPDPGRPAATDGGGFREWYPEVVSRLQRGDDPLDIARQFGIGVREVELVRHVLRPPDTPALGERLS